MAKVNVLLTFDYELPLGGIHGTFEQSLFEPNETLLALSEKLQVPLSFFADVLCYDRFKSMDRDDFAKPFEAQLQKAFLQGHDVQLHLHPHWLDTRIEGRKFFPSELYGLHCFTDSPYPNNIEGIIEKGISILKEIISPTQIPYNCIAYRGGGYVLAPETRRILSALYNNGIRIDATISRGYFFKSDRSHVDYTATPARANWFLDLAGDFSIENTGKESIWEIPIASKPKRIFEMPTSFKMKKYAHRAPSNRGVMIHEKPVAPSVSERIKALLSSRMLSFDNYTYSLDFPIKILDHHIKKYKKDKPIYLCAISHPKSMGAYSFELMEHFIDESRKKYGDDIAFTTFTEVQKELNF